MDKILSPRELLPSCFGLRYHEMSMEIGDTLSKGEQEYLKNRTCFGLEETIIRPSTSEDYALYELEWTHIVKNVSK